MTDQNPAIPAASVARELIEIAGADRYQLTPLKLMKLVYLCHGWSLAHLGSDLIREEVQAWQYGPVIPELYAEIRNFRAEPVPADALSAGAEPTELQKSLIRSVYNAYKLYSGVQLSALTHKSGTPWDKTWRNGTGRNKPIQTAEIKDHFKSLLAA